MIAERAVEPLYDDTPVEAKIVGLTPEMANDKLMGRRFDDLQHADLVAQRAGRIMSQTGIVVHGSSKSAGIAKRWKAIFDRCGHPNVAVGSLV
jgi:hypothetical protein